MNEREKVNQITEGVIWKQLLLFFFPIVFGTFFQQIYNTADTIVVGRFVGKQALAAVGGSASQIANLIVGFFVGLSSGAAVVICARLAETITPYCPSAESRPTHICIEEPIFTIWYSEPS